MVSAWSGFSENRTLFLVYRWPLSCYILTWWRERVLWSFHSLVRAPFALGRLHPHDVFKLNYIRKVPSPNAITLGIRTSAYKFGGNRKIQSRAMSFAHFSIGLFVFYLLICSSLYFLGINLFLVQTLITDPKRGLTLVLR